MNTQATSEQNCITKNEIKTELDVKDSCRICKANSIILTNMFDGEGIIEKVLFCTGIQFLKDDGLPQHMCINCLKDLSVAHRFKTRCLLAKSSFQNESNLKTEAIYDEDCNDNEEIVIEGEDEAIKEEPKPEIEIVCDVKQDSATDDRKTASVVVNKQKKRSPCKKNSKLKQTKKEGQPTVKKKEELSDDTEGTFNAKYHEKRLRCEPCGLVFDSRPLADAHRATAHKGEACWICEICGQQFAHRGSLSTHTRSHFAPRHACALCSYRAAHKYDLTKHQRIHAGDRPYQCDMCPAAFYDTSNMNSHIRRNHQKLVNFRCDVCGRGFYDRSKLNRHVDSHNNIKRHECSQCGTAFSRLSYLKTHMRKRHGVELPPLRPGPQRKNLIVDLPPVQYEKPTLIAVKKDKGPS